MTLLQKLENAYLAILRFAVILVSGLLLVAAICLFIAALPAIKPEPEAKDEVPKISADEMINLLATPSLKPESSAPNKSPAKADAQDPNDIHIDRAATVIQKFVRDKSGGAVEIKFDSVKEIISQNVNTQDSPDLSAAYAASLAGSIEKALYSPAVLALFPTAKANTSDVPNAMSEAPASNVAVQIVNNFLTKYRERFAEIVATQRKEKMAAVQRRADAKAAAVMSLYGAVGAFAMFMLVVFLSIFIKIERNLRPAYATCKNITLDSYTYPSKK